MKQLVVHSHTQKLLEGYKRAPAHALLLVGPFGAGKGSLAAHLAEQTLGLKGKPLSTYAYAMRIAPKEKTSSIGIEEIRNLEQFLKLKVPRKASVNRAIIIEQADMMTTEAQNALLKMLEEPPADTLLLLTATHEKALLPTIRSRVQVVPVQRPERQKIITHFERLFADASLDQVYAMSGGLPGLMQTLLEDSEHPLFRATNTARTLLQQTIYERLLSVDELSKDKTFAKDVAYILQQMAHVSLRSAKGETARKWRSVLKASHEASEGLAANGQPKLVLTNLMFNM